MKKANDPSAASLREIPEVDPAAYRVRRNPFARRVAREGIELVAPRSERRPVRSPPPSRASVREMPEARGKARRSPYAARVTREGIVLQVGRGRPRAGAETGETVPKSVRFPERVWTEVARAARKQGLSVHAALRAAVLAWLRRAA